MGFTVFYRHLLDLLCTANLASSLWVMAGDNGGQALLGRLLFVGGPCEAVTDWWGEWSGEAENRLLTLLVRLNEKLCFWRTFIMASFSASWAVRVFTLNIHSQNQGLTLNVNNRNQAFLSNSWAIRVIHSEYSVQTNWTNVLSFVGFSLLTIIHNTSSYCIVLLGFFCTQIMCQNYWKTLIQHALLKFRTFWY